VSRRVAGACAFALTLALGPVAGANAPAPYVQVPTRLGGAFVQQATTLVVEHEELTFRCGGDAVSCLFEAVYHVRNDGQAREVVLGAFYGIASTSIKIRAGGVDARRELTDEQSAAMDAAVKALDPAIAADYGASVSRVGFTLAVDAHARVDLVFSGTTEPVRIENQQVLGEWAIPPLTTRHPWLATEERLDGSLDFAYALSPIRSWAGSPTIDVSVRFPGSLRWSGARGVAWKRTREGTDEVARATVAAADASTLRFGFVKPGTTILWGGPLVGVGGRLDAKELRVRLGYEVAQPSWAIYSAAVETSFHGRTTLVPLAEAATPDLLFVIPSLALGAGVPVQLRSGASTLVGARAQLTVAFPIVSMVVPFDWFPAGTSADRFQISMMAQASF